MHFFFCRLVECNLWASGPLELNLPLCLSSNVALSPCAFRSFFSFPFSTRWMDLCCDPGAWLLLFFFFASGGGCTYMLLQSSSQLLFLFLVLGGLFQESRLFDTVSNSSGVPFNNQSIEGELTSFFLSQPLLSCCSIQC